MNAPAKIVELSKPAALELRPGHDRSALDCLIVVARHRGVHLSLTQLVHDNVLAGSDVSTAQLLQCARNAGLKAKLLHLNWRRLAQLNKALPAIVVLKNGAAMVLLRVTGEPDEIRIVLQDPNAGEDALLVIDRVRFEEAWSGEVILVKRNYDISDEKQPFSIGLVAALIFRERWMVRDIAICAVILSFLALTPIMFWRLLSDKVIYFKAYNTFFVLCLAMAVLVIFEAIFAYVRQFLIVHLTTRVDVKLAHLYVRQGPEPADGFLRTHADRKDHARHAPNVEDPHVPDGTAVRHGAGFQRPCWSSCRSCSFSVRS